MVRTACRKQSRRKRPGRHRQRGGFLSRYDFAYAGRDTVNQAFKNIQSTALGLMKQLTDQMNNVAQQRIQQVLDQGEQEIKKIAPKTIRGTIKDAYQTPFRLLGRFGKKKLTQVKSKFKNVFRKFT